MGFSAPGTPPCSPTTRNWPPAPTRQDSGAPWRTPWWALMSSSASPGRAWSPGRWWSPWPRTPFSWPWPTRCPRSCRTLPWPTAPPWWAQDGRDFPNQINNVLVFPGLFKGALSCGAVQITEGMKHAAALGSGGLGPPGAALPHLHSSLPPQPGRSGGRGPRRRGGSPVHRACPVLIGKRKTGEPEFLVRRFLFSIFSPPVCHFTTVSHSRMRMVATWARVALPWGFRVVSVTPVMSFWALAQAKASLA